MKRVCLYLPPFSGDYSGVCSALFDLGGMICIHDAAGCTGNYTHFDEPRWYGSDSRVFCTGLRKLDAVLGDDEHIIRRINSAAGQTNPRFIAIVGSPVPNVIGFDFKGVARAITKRTGIPCFGFATAGIRGSYKDGIVMAVRDVTEGLAGTRATSSVPGVVNILGASPLDTAPEIFDALVGALRADGFDVRRKTNSYGSLDQILYPQEAEISLAFNQAGFELARLFEARYGTPYLAGFPVGATEAWLSSIREVIRSGKSRVFRTRGAAKGARDQPDGGEKTGSPDGMPRACIIGDGLAGSAFADFLSRRGYACDVYTIFGTSAGMQEFCDGYLHHEDAILEKISEPYDLFVADPLILERIRAGRACRKISAPVHAVSSRAHMHESWQMTSEAEWDRRLNTAAADK